MSTSTSTSTEEKKKIITLKSSDLEVFEVEEAVVSQSETIKNMIEDGCADDHIPLPNVTGAILSKVIEYCKKHVSEPSDAGEKEELKKWDAEFIKVEEKVVFDLILAANYLNIKGLMDVTCQSVADAIKDFMPEQIREKFNIINDFTEKEEEEVRRENAWAFEV